MPRWTQPIPHDQRTMSLACLHARAGHRLAAALAPPTHQRLLPLSPSDEAKAEELRKNLPARVAHADPAAVLIEFLEAVPAAHDRPLHLRRLARTGKGHEPVGAGIEGADTRPSAPRASRTGRVNTRTLSADSHGSSPLARIGQATSHSDSQGCSRSRYGSTGSGYPVPA